MVTIKDGVHESKQILVDGKLRGLISPHVGNPFKGFPEQGLPVVPDGKWFSTLMVDGKAISLGNFHNKREAISAILEEIEKENQASA